MGNTFAPGPQSDGEYAVCPHCGCRQGDCWEWVTGAEEDCECPGCGRTFLVIANYDVTYLTREKPGASNG